MQKENQNAVYSLVSSRTRHLSGTLIAESDTSLEHCLDSNNTYTNYSSGHPISVDPLPLHPPVTIHFRLNFYHFLPDLPSPPSTGCHKCIWSLTLQYPQSKREILCQKEKATWFFFRILCRMDIIYTGSWFIKVESQ